VDSDESEHPIPHRINAVISRGDADSIRPRRPGLVETAAATATVTFDGKRRPNTWNTDRNNHARARSSSATAELSDHDDIAVIKNWPAGCSSPWVPAVSTIGRLAAPRLRHLRTN